MKHRSQQTICQEQSDTVEITLQSNIGVCAIIWNSNKIKFDVVKCHLVLTIIFMSHSALCIKPTIGPASKNFFTITGRRPLLMTIFSPVSVVTSYSNIRFNNISDQFSALGNSPINITFRNNRSSHYKLYTASQTILCTFQFKQIPVFA